jgi:mxaJ protein
MNRGGAGRVKRRFATQLLVRSSLLFIAGAALAETPLRVCADPNNLPFSNAAGEGFENKLAVLIAQELNRPLQFVWRAQRRGFIREGLKAGECDLVTAIPLGIGEVRSTRPYYRSTYAFVTRPGEPRAASFDDEGLATRLIGVQLIGDNGANSPPAHLLARRGLVRNIRGYSVYGDYGQPEPTRRIVDAVADREIDVAAVWGPIGGYFASMEKPPLVVTPIAQPNDTPIALSFDIAMAVRKQDVELAAGVNRALDSLAPQVHDLLEAYHVPLEPE